MATAIAVPAATKTFSAQALQAELGRRRNNRARGTNSRSRSWVFGAMTADDIELVMAGEVVTVTFGSGRVETVAVKA